MAKLFQRTIEDFTCEHCDLLVSGNGYTNHCPKCLWSKHVDIHPGDREASCGGMMAPIRAVQENGEWVIIQKCVSCGHERKNKFGPTDDFDALVAISHIHD